MDTNRESIVLVKVEPNKDKLIQCPLRFPRPDRFFVTHQWTYGIGNVLGLIASIAGTPDGERDFPCDVRAVSYPEYAPITTLGFRRHFLHEPDSTLPLARRRLRRITALKYAFHAVQAAVAVLAVRWVWQRLAAGGIMGVAVFV